MEFYKKEPDGNLTSNREEIIEYIAQMLTEIADLETVVSFFYEKQIEYFSNLSNVRIYLVRN